RLFRDGIGLRSGPRFGLARGGFLLRLLFVEAADVARAIGGEARAVVFSIRHGARFLRVGANEDGVVVTRGRPAEALLGRRHGALRADLVEPRLIALA